MSTCLLHQAGKTHGRSRRYAPLRMLAHLLDLALIVAVVAVMVITWELRRR